jgi:hypothetical protein
MAGEGDGEAFFERRNHLYLRRHGLEHLGRNDDRPALSVALAHNFLLSDGHFGPVYAGYIYSVRFTQVYLLEAAYGGISTPRSPRATMIPSDT